MERSRSIFGNAISNKDFKKALKLKNKHSKKFGDDSETIYRVGIEKNSILEPFIGVQNIVVSEAEDNLDNSKGVIIGNIRMGFGHYRISIAMASAAYSMGYTPYWFDLHSYSNTIGGKVIAHLNSLYSLGSRWSQKYPLFNKLYWEPLNSEGFRKLSYNAADQKTAELMTPIYRGISKDMPFVATHVWPAQAAIHAGLTRVVNAIPDNWPMALHLSEGAIHTVQTPSAFLGYKTLKGMDGDRVLKPIPEGEIFDVGHYIDHELVSNLEYDCEKRLVRIRNKSTKRILLTVGGAGAQRELFANIIKKLLPEVKGGKVALYINVGDHRGVLEGLLEDIPELKNIGNEYYDDWSKTCAFAQSAIEEDIRGVHIFYHKDIFAAVYATNLLMRSSDLIITKPSELAFYPVPKLMIKRIGGHEAWGAIRTAELGDGTIECQSLGDTLQMLNLILTSDELLTNMCNNIIRANKIGTYNGAYRVIELATGK